jgi:hypothetical protein
LPSFAQDFYCQACLSISLFLCLSLYLFVSMSVSLSLCFYVCLSIYLLICLYISLVLCLSLYLFVSMSVSLSICFSVSLSLWFYVCLSISLLICLSVSSLHLYPLSLYLPVCQPIRLSTHPSFSPLAVFAIAAAQSWLDVHFYIEDVYVVKKELFKHEKSFIQSDHILFD